MLYRVRCRGSVGLAKVVVSKLNPPARTENGSVTAKRVRDSEGKLRTIRTLNVGSATFGDDLTYVFRKNVAKARRENKQVVGSTDLVPAKR